MQSQALNRWIATVATKWLAGAAFLLVLAPHVPASAQQISIGAAFGTTRYSGKEHDSASGDRFGEVAVRYHQSSRAAFGIGASVGKFDDPASDPSFTALSVFLDGALTLARVNSFGVSLGPRVSWEHERVGEQEDGLWAYGVSYGAVARVAYEFQGGATLGLQTGAQYLDLARSDTPTLPVRDARGWRFQIAVAGALPVFRSGGSATR